MGHILHGTRSAATASPDLHGKSGHRTTARNVSRAGCALVIGAASTLLVAGCLGASSDSPAPDTSTPEPDNVVIESDIEPDAEVAPEVSPEPDETPVPDSPIPRPRMEWDNGVLECGVNAKPAIDQDIVGNWWAYCEPALIE